MDKKLPSPKPQLYAHYFFTLQEIAKEFGYNLVVHGSMNRDLDLVAIPWTDSAQDEFTLINALSKCLTGHTTEKQYKHLVYLYRELPGGRHSYVINLNRGGYKKDDTGMITDPLEYTADPEYYLDISVIPPPKKTPKKICYCGSLRVAADAFKEAEYKSVLDGNIALLPCCMFVDIQREYGAESDYKVKADELHKRKIDICDEVVVLNVGGYIGESTRSEIEYAEKIGKPIVYLEPINSAVKSEMK